MGDADVIADADVERGVFVDFEAFGEGCRVERVFLTVRVAHEQAAFVGVRDEKAFAWATARGGLGQLDNPAGPIEPQVFLLGGGEVDFPKDGNWLFVGQFAFGLEALANEVCHPPALGMGRRNDKGRPALRDGLEVGVGQDLVAILVGDFADGSQGVELLKALHDASLGKIVDALAVGVVLLAADGIEFRHVESGVFSQEAQGVAAFNGAVLACVARENETPVDGVGQVGQALHGGDG